MSFNRNIGAMKWVNTVLKESAAIEMHFSWFKRQCVCQCLTDFILKFFTKVHVVN